MFYMNLFLCEVAVLLLRDNRLVTNLLSWIDHWAGLLLTRASKGHTFMLIIRKRFKILIKSNMARTRVHSISDKEIK